MYLKSVELSGFKSFAKKSNLEFNTPISAIVGPNGSGKSNVAEAFRFVLGEQSIKSLRGKKGEDLIFNGAGDGSRSNRASVKVTFDNSRKFLNVDFDEVVIERAVHRDGVNEYFINGSQVRLKDIVELLSGAHIGASGHHIISQGEADRILNSNLRERRAMIEDALGLKIYQYKRAESERKLEKTLENIQSVDALRKEIAPHIKFLKKQVEKIEKAAQLKNELVDLAKEYLKRESLYISKAESDLLSAVKPLEEKKKKLDEELVSARKILESSKNKDARSQEVIDMEQSIQDLRIKKDLLLQELGKIQGEISSEERIIKKQREIISSETGKTILFSDVESFAEEIKIKFNQIEISNDISLIKKIFGEVKGMFSNFLGTKKVETNDSIIKESENVVEGLKKKRSLFEADLGDIRQKEEWLEKSYKVLKGKIEKEKDSNRDAEKTLFRIMAEENSTVSELATLNAKRETLLILNDDFKREREECAVLAGRGVLDYESFNLDISQASAEERNQQEERRRRLEKMKIRLEDSGLSIGTDVMKEFEDASERDAFLNRELEDLTKSAESLRDLITELGETLDQEFKEGITKINKQFQEYFALMFGGGTARLAVIKETKRPRKDTQIELDMDEISLESPDEEKEEEGIDIEVSLPRKKIKGLMMLSGGERALTSIALLFAMSQVKPPPFIILDETDAALDEANSKKYGDMIENLSKYSQLILITHNRETMSRAGVIYGITMGGGGISKVLSIQFDEALTVAK